MCEKPLTPTVAEAETLIEVASRVRVPLMEAMWTYFLPPLERARQWVQDGRIGSIRHIKAEFGHTPRYDPQSRLYAPELAGGALLDIGIYPIAFAWFFLGRDPDRVQVVGRMAKQEVEVAT